MAFLSISWSTSRGADTYGYNICRLNTSQGETIRCMGGGYDMVGTVFGDWLEREYQPELLAIAGRFSRYTKAESFVRRDDPEALYGGTYYADKATPKVSLDGACGIDSMRRIADAIGLDVHAEYSAGRRGRLIGFSVGKKSA